MEKYISENEIFNKNIPKFSYDLNDKGSKTWLLWGISDFVRCYSKMKDERRVYYEIIPDNIPLKLFFDLEYNPLDEMNKNINVDKCISIINSSVHSVLNLKDSNKHSPLVLDSSKKNKTSKHIIYEILFKNMICLKMFIDDVLEHIKSKAPSDYAKITCGIDSSVYNRNRNFRLYASHKKGKNECLYPIINDTLYKTFDYKILFKSLITCYIITDDNDDKTIPLPENCKDISKFILSDIFDYPLECEIDDSRPSRKRMKTSKNIIHKEVNNIKYSDVDEKLINKMVERLKKTYFEKHYPECLKENLYYNNTRDLNGRKWLSISLKNMPCKNVNKCHKSNRIFLNIDITEIIKRGVKTLSENRMDMFENIDVIENDYILEPVCDGYFLCQDDDCKKKNGKRFTWKCPYMKSENYSYAKKLKGFYDDLSI